MNARFQLDPETGEPNCYRHGEFEDEVTDVLIVPSKDRPGLAGSRVAIGRTRGGRNQPRATVIEEPRELVSAIRELIARFRAARGLVRKQPFRVPDAHPEAKASG